MTDKTETKSRERGYGERGAGRQRAGEKGEDER